MCLGEKLFSILVILIIVGWIYNVISILKIIIIIKDRNYKVQYYNALNNLSAFKEIIQEEEDIALKNKYKKRLLHFYISIFSLFGIPILYFIILWFLSKIGVI